MECNQTYCNSNCLNADEQKPVTNCDVCGGGIYANAMFVINTDDEKICFDCIENASTLDLIKLMGAEVHR